MRLAGGNALLCRCLGAAASTDGGERAATVHQSRPFLPCGGHRHPCLYRVGRIALASNRSNLTCCVWKYPGGASASEQGAGPLLRDWRAQRAPFPPNEERARLYKLASGEFGARRKVRAQRGHLPPERSGGRVYTSALHRVRHLRAASPSGLRVELLRQCPQLSCTATQLRVPLKGEIDPLQRGVRNPHTPQIQKGTTGDRW